MASGVYKVTIGRMTKMDGRVVGNAMSVNTWAAFAGSDEEAVVDGDFAMLEPELQPVLKALRGAGIQPFQRFVRDLANREFTGVNACDPI